jgi:hypothetical protein
LVFAAIGLFGAAFAISAVVIDLPDPAVGGTCGPGALAETPFVALVNPGSIGAGKEPPASDKQARDQWLAFVGECQASANGRGLAALGILVVSVLVAWLGPKLFLWRRKGKDRSPGGVDTPEPGPPPSGTVTTAPATAAPVTVAPVIAPPATGTAGGATDTGTPAIPLSAAPSSAAPY